jgi:hypothetical protein
MEERLVYIKLGKYHPCLKGPIVFIDQMLIREATSMQVNRYSSKCKGTTLWTPTLTPRLKMTFPKPYNIPQTSPVTPNIVSRLHRTSKTFGDLHKPS